MENPKIVETAEFLGATYYGKDVDGDVYGYNYKIKLRDDACEYELRTFQFITGRESGLIGKGIEFDKTTLSGYSDFELVDKKDLGEGQDHRDIEAILKSPGSSVEEAILLVAHVKRLEKEKEELQDGWRWMMDCYKRTLAREPVRNLDEVFSYAENRLKE